MQANCDLPPQAQIPKYLTQWHIRALEGVALAIVNTLSNREDATAAEINLGKECEDILNRIVHYNGR